METINVANICRLCLAEHKDFSEPLSNWLDDIFLIFRLEVFLDDGLPQQICFDCSHTLMITSKLRETVHETDMLLKTTRITDVKQDLENVDEEQLEEYTNEIDVKFNYPDLNDLAMPIDKLIMHSRPTIKSEMKVVLEKLPDHISCTSLTYCSICLLAFTDSERFLIHLKLNVHNTNKCSFCCIQYENGAQLWKHINLVHVEFSLVRTKRRRNQHANMTEEQRKKKAEYTHNYYVSMTEEQEKKKAEYARKRLVNMTDEQRKKRAEYHRKRYANMTDEQRKKRAEYHRKRYANMTEEQQKKLSEYYRKRYANKTEEQLKKDSECRHNQRSNMTEEQRRKEVEYKRKQWANMTEEQRKKRAERRRNQSANMTEEQRKKTAECRRNQRANMTEEQWKKYTENYRKHSANMTEEQRKKIAEHKRKHYANKKKEQLKKKAEYNRKQRANKTEEQ